MMPENAEKSKLSRSNISTTDAKWWETAEDHRFALEVLQLRLRRNILKFLAQDANTRTIEEIEKEFSLNSNQAMYHLAMLKRDW
jgi:hypothetical protein